MTQSRLRSERAPRLAPPAAFRWKYAPLRRKVRAVRFPCFTARFLRLIEQARPNRLVQTLIFQVLRD